MRLNGSFEYPLRELNEEAGRRRQAESRKLTVFCPHAKAPTRPVRSWLAWGWAGCPGDAHVHRQIQGGADVGPRVRPLAAETPPVSGSPASVKPLPGCDTGSPEAVRRFMPGP